MKKASELDQRRHARAKRRLEHVIARPAEAERTKTGLIGDAEKIVAFGEGSDRAAFALGEAPLRALHEAAPPGVGGGVAKGPEDGLSCRRREAAAGQCESGLDREAVRIAEPFRRILEHYGLIAPHLVASCQAERTRASVEVDMDFDVSHDRLDPASA